MQAAISNPTDRIGRGGGRLLFNADGSVSLSLPALVGLSQAGTAPAAVGSGTGTSAGTYSSLATPAGGASPNAGGGAGGAIVWTTGPGGAATSVTTGTGGTGGAHTVSLGAGGANTTGQGGVGGAYTYVTGAGGLGNSTQAGTGGVVSGNGGAGGAHATSTGPGGAGDGTAALSGAGGTGGLISRTAGIGGAGANGGANTSRGGNGGAITDTTGAGGAGSNNGAGSGNGGAGGIWTTVTGAGGNASQTGSGQGIGGAGGNYVSTAGAGGLGSAAVSGVSLGTGGAGGTYTYSAGVGGASASGQGGAGGFFQLNGGGGGNSTSTTNSVNGGAAGYWRYLGANGGTSTTGNGGAAGRVETLPVSSMISGFSLSLGNGGNTSFATGVAGAGAGVYVLTGSAGASPSSSYTKGGDFDLVLGSGNDPSTSPAVKPFSNGRNGQLQIFAPWLVGSTPYALNGPNQATVVVGSLGLGIGAGPNLGTPLNVVWDDVDPTYAVNGLASGENLTLSHDLDPSLAMQNQAAGIHMFGPGALTCTSGNGVSDDEFHIYSTPIGADPHIGPVHVYVRGTYGKFHLEDWQAATAKAGFGSLSTGYTNIPTPADVTIGYGGVFEAVHQGTGTVATGVGVFGSIVSGQVDNIAQAWRDPQWVNAYAFMSHISFTSAQTGSLGSVVPNTAGYYATTPLLNGTGTVLTQVFGFNSEAMRNTSNATTAIPGLTLAAGGAKFTVATQTATVGTVIDNYGVYVTGNGGGAGAGGATVRNWALFSDSTAMSQLNRLTLNGNLAINDTFNVLLGTVTGTIWGTVGGAAGQKQAWWGATPIVQPLFATGASHTVDQLITQLQTMGLLRQT